MSAPPVQTRDGAGRDEAPGFVETLGYLASAGALGVALFRYAGRPGAEVPAVMLDAAQWLAPLIAGLALVVPRVPERLRGWLAVGIGSLTAMTVSAYLLRDTPLSLGGDSQDAGFIIEQLVKAKHYVLPRDGTYAGLAPFYPPLYTQVLGKLAALLDMEAAATWKLGALAVTVIAPALAFAGWAALVGRTTAAAVVTLSAFAEPVLHLYKTHEWLVLVLFLPWWLRYVSAERESDASARRQWIIGAVFGALLAMTFYYPFFVGAVVLLLAAIARLARRAAPFPAASIAVLGGAVVLSAGYWLPLAYEGVTIAFTPLQQRWFRDYMNDFPIAFSLAPRDLALLGGVACGLIVPRARRVVRSEAAAPSVAQLSALVSWAAACLIWYALGRLAVTWGHPVLHIKAVPLLHHTLAVALVLGITAVTAALRGSRWERAAAAAIVLVALGSNLRAYAAVESTEWYAKAKPSAGRWSEQRFRKLTRGLDLLDKTVLAATSGTLKYSAAFSFLGFGAHYAHPSAQFAGRYAFLRSLVTLDASNDVCTLLRHNRYTPVDYVWWRNGTALQVYLDDFPSGVRGGHFEWPGAGKQGPCLPRLAPKGVIGHWQRVLDPGPAAARALSPAARALAARHGDAWLRRTAGIDGGASATSKR